MADVTDILLKEMELQGAQALHIENQRSTMTNMIIVLAAAGFGFVSQRGIGEGTLIVTLPLIALGLYGALASAKLYERFRLHSVRAHQLQLRLDELVPGVDLRETRKSARIINDGRYKILSRVRLHIIWVMMHLSIAAAGLVLTVIALV